MLYKNINISESAFYNVSEEAAKELIDYRLSVKKPLTQRAFTRAMQECQKAEQYGLTPDQAIELTIDKGWIGVVAEYIAKEMSNRQDARFQIGDAGVTIARLTDRSWAGEH